MQHNKKQYFIKSIILIITIAINLSSCHKPPYNDFKKDQPKIKRPGYGLAVGAVVGAVFGATFVGTLIGGGAMTAMTLSKTNRSAVLKNLNNEDIQFIQYGDTCTLIVPTDHYFLFNSARLNNICYKGLNDIIRLLEFYPNKKIYVAAFTDNVGTTSHKNRLSEARAQAMLTFLWAHDIDAEKLSAQGYGELYPIGDNKLIRGSAFNRRIEIQWSAGKEAPEIQMQDQSNMKE